MAALLNVFQVAQERPWQNCALHAAPPHALHFGLPSPTPLSCLSIIVPVFSALSTFPEREQLGCWSHRGNIFLTTLQIPLLYEN